MIYKAVEEIWIFSADGRTGRAGRADIEGSIRGPRGPKNGVGNNSQMFAIHINIYIIYTIIHINRSYIDWRRMSGGHIMVLGDRSVVCSNCNCVT